MAKPKRITGKGMGWHKQSLRHRNARKYGRAGGKYSTKIIKASDKKEAKWKFLARVGRGGFQDANKYEVLEVKELKKPKYGEYQLLTKEGKYSLKVRKKDSDSDGVPDKFDCEPFNPKEQGLFHKHKKELDIAMTEAIRKETNPEKKEKLKEIKEELRIAETHNALKSFIQRNKFTLSSAGISIGLLITGLAIGSTGALAPFSEGIGVGLAGTGFAGGVLTTSTISQIHSKRKEEITKITKQLEKEGMPEKEAHKIATKVVNERLMEGFKKVRIHKELKKEIKSLFKKK